MLLVMLLLMLQNLTKANNSKSCFIKHDKTLKDDQSSTFVYIWQIAPAKGYM